MRHRWLAALIATAVLPAVLAAACGGGGGGGSRTVAPTATTAAGETPAGETPSAAAATVQVGLTDSPFSVTADASSVPAGTVTFDVQNTGTIFHNFRVIKTELDPASLPMDPATFTVDESQVDVVGSLAELDAGTSDTLSVDLAPGKYVLICNVPTHYQAGMHLAFEVTD